MVDVEPSLRQLEPRLDRAIDHEYAAVSTLAVLSLVLGLLSLPALALAFVSSFKYWLLNLIPLAAVVLASAGLYRIRRSEGTLAGRRIAMVGLALGGLLLLSGIVLHGHRHLERRAYRAEVREAAFAQFKDFAPEGLGRLYDRFGESFRAKVWREGFVGYLAGLSRGAGEIQKREVISIDLFPRDEGDISARVFFRLRGKSRCIDMRVWFERVGEGEWRPLSVSAGWAFEP